MGQVNVPQYDQYLACLNELSLVEPELVRELAAAEARRHRELDQLNSTPELELRREHTRHAEQALVEGGNILAVLGTAVQIPRKRRPTSLDLLRTANTSQAREAVEQALRALQQSVASVQMHRKQQAELERAREARELQRLKDEAAAEAERRWREAQRAAAAKRRRRIIRNCAAAGVIGLLALLLVVI